MTTPYEQATALFRAGQLGQAEAVYRRLLHDDPDDGRALWGLGNIALRIRRPEMALPLLERACAALPGEPFPRFPRADALNALGRPEDALAVLTEAVAAAPRISQSHYQLGRQQHVLGDFDSAIGSFRRALENGSESLRCHCYYELSRLNAIEDAELAQITRDLAQPRMPSDDAMILHYACGDALEHRQQFTTAFEHYERANELQYRRCTFRTEQLGPFFGGIVDAFTPQSLARRAPPQTLAPTPIFIVGLPRTGSTLLEQMLSRHSQIEASGESQILGTDVDALLLEATGKHFPASGAGAPESLLRKAASHYRDRMLTRAITTPFATDKSLSNFQAIGLIYKLFPQARVIHMTRDVRAVAVSVFKNYFAEDEPYFCSLSEFATYQQLYADLMAYWREVVPGFVIDVTYEALLLAPERTLADLLERCGLPWEAPCLADTAGTRAVHTLSGAQVRKPLYRDSLDSWKRYAAHLPALLSDSP